ncbi:PTAC2 [Symbiodinium sp. CCMP2456]|nr:PTAC2 [Symbiodinium sp. CCMP2456]
MALRPEVALRTLSCGRWESVLEVIAPVLQKGTVAPRILTKALTSLASEGRAWTSWQVLQAMASGGITPSAHHCSAAIGACRRSGQWPLAVHMLAFMGHSRSRPNHLCLNLALGCCSTNREAAQRLLVSMQSWALVPDIIGFRTVLGSCEQAGDWEVALRLFEEMHVAMVQADQRCYTALIRAFGKRDHWQPALTTFAEMCRQAVPLDQITYCSTMDVCDKSGHWQVSLQLLQALKEDLLIPDVQSYGSAMSACGTGAAWQLAVALLGEMEEAIVVPSALAASAALSAAETSSAWQACLVLLEALPHWRLPVTALQAASAANALRVRQGSEDAWRLLERIRNRWQSGAACFPGSGVCLPDAVEKLTTNVPGAQALAVGSGVAAFLKPAGRRSEALLEKLSSHVGLNLQSVSRLDFSTSGVLLVALGDANSTAFRWIQAQIAARLVEKEYLCLVEGPAMGPAGVEGCAEMPLRDIVGPTGTRSEVASHGRSARTEFRVLQRFATPVDSGEELMLLRVRLLTGRRHQIRVHLASVGRPVVGDLTYGRRWKSFLPDCPRLWLHCEHIALRDLEGSPFAAFAPLPEELEVILSRLMPKAGDADGGAKAKAMEFKGSLHCLLQGYHKKCPGIRDTATATLQHFLPRAACLFVCASISGIWVRAPETRPLQAT